MKLLSILLCFYMTMLAILPCQDKDDFVTSLTITSVRTSHGATEKSAKESCTPLCSCSCCSVSRLLVRQQLTANVFSQQVKPDYADVVVPAPTQLALPIWQPPQLS